jgi:endonuclease/exonuclease/phosphatase (EEP) superfamily protein YafD
VCFLLFTSLLFVGCSGPKSKTIKVMTWNIWHGGLHGTEADGFKKDSVNTINVYKVIHQEAPDVLLMQETYCCGMEIAEQAGYPHSVRASSNLSIHSKYPIMDTLKIFNPFNAHAAVIDVEGQELLFVNTWLHYLPDSFEGIKTMSPDSLIANEGPTRLKEITAIISAVDRLKTSLKIPVIIGGDFNSPSHLDWVESTKEFHYGKVVAWPVSTLMQERDYIDSFREAHPDPTQTLEGTWGYLSPREIISDRIDFVYYKGQNLKTISSKIVMEDPEGGFFNSDHRAILTQFELKN